MRARLVLAVVHGVVPAVVSASMLGCGAAPQSKPDVPAGGAAAAGASSAPPGAASAEPLPGEWGSSAWQEVRLSELALALSLPDAASWTELPPRGSWRGARHDRTHSELWLSHTSARRSVSAAECEKEARASLALLRAPGAVASMEPLRAPEGYLGSVSVVVRESGGGLAFASGAGTSRCFAAVFATEAQGAWLSRLDAAQARLLPSVRRLGPEERARPL